jgi:hypothetical protein
LRRVLSSYHSAITGGLMFSRNTLSYFKVIPSDAFSSSSGLSQDVVTRQPAKAPTMVTREVILISRAII